MNTPGAPASSNVAVLGATGCMGRRVSRVLADRGHGVVAVSRRRTPAVSSRHFVPMDLARVSPQRFSAFLEAQQVDVVVNTTLGWGEETFPTNVRLVESVLEAIRMRPVAPRLVHLGTIHEYGPVPWGASVDEGVPPAPRMAYPRSKLAAAKMVLDSVRKSLNGFFRLGRIKTNHLHDTWELIQRVVSINSSVQ